MNATDETQVQTRVEAVDATLVQPAVPGGPPTQPPAVATPAEEPTTSAMNWGDLCITLAFTAGFGAALVMVLGVIGVGDRKLIWAMSVGALCVGMAWGMAYFGSGLIEAVNHVVRRRRS